MKTKKKRPYLQRAKTPEDILKENLFSELVYDKVIIALDGRSYRWLANKLSLSDSEVSNSMAGYRRWKEEELNYFRTELKLTI